MAAIEIASRLDEIEFPEFTSKLVKDTFDTLVASQVDQLEAYSKLLSDTAKSLSTYINDTEDSISGEEIFDFVTSVLPDLEPTSIDAENSGDTPLDSDQADKLDKAVTVSEDDGTGTPIQAAGEITTSSPSSVIIDAVAKRISANKYEILVKMVEMGLIRLVVTDGMIESKLNFTTYEFATARQASSTYRRNSSGARGGLSFGVGAFRLKASGGFSRLKVSTKSSTASQSSGTNINIQGMVRINFKSDYRALSEPV